MRIVSVHGVPKRPVGDMPLFTGGAVTIQYLVTRSMGKDFNVAVVNFDKGARNKFHSHTSDQVLIVTDGKGIVSTEGEERVVQTGDAILIPAGEKHRHGATKDSDFSHISLVVKGSEITQLED